MTPMSQTPNQPEFAHYQPGEYAAEHLRITPTTVISSTSTTSRSM